MHSLKSLKNRTKKLLIAAAVTLPLIFGSTAIAAFPARAEDTVDDIKEFTTTDLGLSNPDFSESSGSYPASPSSWTGEALDGGFGNIVKGVVDLKPSVYSDSKNGNKNLLLDQYSEYADETNIPKTIFGGDSKYGGDEKALLINTAKGASVAYAYKSSEMSLVRNSFYRFSVWVKTGDFSGQSGATVKLSGLGQNLSFNNINTMRDGITGEKLVLDEENNFGWVKYTMYVRTSAALTKSVQLVLGIGDAYKNDKEDPTITPRPTSGYAFFDTVKAERISAFDFAFETQNHSPVAGRDNLYTFGNGTSLAIDLCETKSFMDGNKEIGTFSQNFDSWKTDIFYDEYDKNPSYVGNAHNIIYNSESRVSDLESSANVNGFTQNPWAPYGRAEYDIIDDSPFFAGARNGNILVISSYNGKEFVKAARGVASPSVTIERFKYYRFSVWIKGDKIEGGDGITLLVKGKPINPVISAPAENDKLLSEYHSLNGDSSDSAHYGWKEHIVYIHGSMLCDYNVRFELWLGSPINNTSGIAMFDNVTFTELKYSDYNAMSSADSGNVLTIDESNATDTISNGSFTKVGDMDELKFPMPAADWTYYTTDNVATKGFSTEAVNTENAVHGIIPTDERTFYSINDNLPGVDKPNMSGLNNVLLLSSVSKTAFCYQSPEITLASDKAYKLTANLAVSRIDGYGASLVLKTSDGDVLSTIENITGADLKFKTYTFYLAAPLSEQKVRVEVWLGLNDRVRNDKKLSSGNVYVKNVSVGEWTVEGDGKVADEYNKVLEKYRADISHGSTLGSLDYGVYSFASPTFDYYDVYSYFNDGEFVTPYKWSRLSANNSFIGGVFNSELRRSTLNLYPEFKRNDLTGGMLYINNTGLNRTVYTFDNTITLAANLYYRIDVNVKVRVTDEIRTDEKSIGANIKLTGSTAEFTNIKDTTTLIDVTNEKSRDYETFKKYSFFISTGTEGGNVGLEIGFGGEARENRIIGKLVVGGIQITEIDNLEFEDAQTAEDSRIIAVTLSSTDDKTEDTTNTAAPSNDIPEWIIPTIFFSAAMLAAIVLISVVRIRDFIKSKRKVVYSNEYGRGDVIREIERLKNLDKDTEKSASESAIPQKSSKSEQTPIEVPVEQLEQAPETPAAASETHSEQTPTEQPESKPVEQKKQPISADDLDD